MPFRGSAQDPLWYKDAVIYETHVKAFFDADNDGVGDFRGLTQKLDYLQELGVTCLWLLPFFSSPLRDDGYDIADYTAVHPSYGTLDDFKAFLNAAHERNLQVIVELVVNHTSDQHPWFQRARKAPPGSVERDFYVWSDSDQKYSDARIIFTDTEKSNWSWDPEAKAYYWHRFFAHQPDLNFDNPAVLQEVIKAMHFWLDMGVDGMRLDAIPYLVEREGTTCENLPETHAVVREMRHALDERYSNRMFLAEANQWPADVLPYFGNEDECHMAFHFPLMPRIFMALRLEDRHPIVEIMGQTPPIPPRCQWGLFLRNHDELTLEMVTADERDYMYLAYSADPRMRINVGIRRRLAPLMENNRRRIELMNSLLFSFPGTPILYYGDEIGMGDNIYLGDRNGVRTPMQWTPDRNGGFSRANPAKLYSPSVMDPVYGYEAINVEAQQSDPSSLLNWMRNMIALRKLFRVFGRGTLEFLEPENRKVLVYLRKYESDQILCVANLSRFGQPVELDLSALAGMTPVEMLGFTEFPAIGKTAYRLTLGPYGFFWFELQGVPEPIDIRQPASGAEACPVVLRKTAEELFEPRARKCLETTVLPEFLPKQRWFGGKARTIESIRVVDWAWIQRDPAAAIAVIEVHFADGGSDLYNAPMGIAVGRSGEELREARPDAVMCGINVGGEMGVLYDAMAHDGVCQALLQAVEQNQKLTTQTGVIQGITTEAFAELKGDAGALKVSRSGAEQSNTSIIFGGRLILKLFRRLEEGPNPDFEISRFLTDHHRFDHVPQLAGGIEYGPSGNHCSTLAMLQQMVPNQGDGWKMTTDELGRYLEESATFHDSPEEPAGDHSSLLDLAEGDIPEAARERIGIYLDAAATLGQRTAQMHMALTSPTDDPAFQPAPITRADLESLASGLREHAIHVFQSLRANLAALPDELVDRAATTLGQRGRMLARFRGLETMDTQMAQIRIHGDYHLGQVLSVQNDFVILDFEGEPARSVVERRRKQPALKDVAGMLRSFSYAAYASLLTYTARRPEEFGRMEPWAAFWEKWVSAVFLKAYLQTAANAPFLPSDRRHLATLLEAFLLDKALYELNYELNNRPTWVRIPLRGILSLAA
ncbi:MAG TPA: maltose alpha-D-glucosyltransferase [Bryobacteraceae bacterium]|jgi:maltose alpha-D-glucosyltransferase/alpha-amylase|nr:maltose alpha-D-glucosyltransferase [Bryobacteraceae bacterium]